MEYSDEIKNQNSSRFIKKVDKAWKTHENINKVRSQLDSVTYRLDKNNFEKEPKEGELYKYG